MARDKILSAIAAVEIIIGCGTLIGVTVSLVLFLNTKTANVLFFVVTTSSVSAVLGAGILNRRKSACNLLIYFSSVIVLSKLLIFADIMRLNGALASFVPETAKNIFSMMYHGFVALYLSRPRVRELFVR